MHLSNLQKCLSRKNNGLLFSDKLEICEYPSVSLPFIPLLFAIDLSAKQKNFLKEECHATFFFPHNVSSKVAKGDYIKTAPMAGSH